MTEHSLYKRQHQWRRKKTERKVPQRQRIKNLESESENGEDVDDDSEISDRNPPLDVDIIENDFGTVKELIKEDSNSIYELGYRKRTALHLAALEGFTPLMYACKSGNPQCVKTLLENGASVNFSDSHGTSSLHLAAMSGDTECVQLLLNLKPKPEQVFFVRDLPRKGRNKLEKKRTVKVSKEDCLSPGNAAIKRRGREESLTMDVKTRRIQFENGGGSTQYQQTIQEGATSEKDVGLCHCSDVERVSPPIPAPLLESVSSIDSAIKIVFDVETTGLATDYADIVQLSAVHGSDEFNIYIIPGQQIDPIASHVNQLTMVGGELLHKGIPVFAEEPEEAFQKFLAWLNAKREKVVLFAHNAKRFDSKLIIYALKKYDLLSSFQECVLGFIDTLTLFKKALPDRKKYSQEKLVADLLGMSYAAHNSLEDVKALQRLVSSQVFDRNQLIESSFSTEFAVQYTEYCERKKFNLYTLQPLIESEVVSKGMVQKMAGSGVSLNHLQHSFEMGGKDGLISILSDQVNGKARVTKNKRIISQLINYFTCNN
ncbi:DNA polymerase III PolC-type-like isoform X2 [Acropora muricata]